MHLKEKIEWLKYLDFILIDLLCLIISFIIGFYLKFESIEFWNDDKWYTLFIMICFINLLIMFIINPYSGILKRRYYVQLKKEVMLTLFQLMTVCFIFYAMKIGTEFSREMMFTTYGLYFVISQPVKYLRKKQLTGEFVKNKKDIRENKKDFSLKIILNKTELHKLFSAFLKRTVDIVGASVGILFLIPLSIIVFIVNRLTDNDGPLFYNSESTAEPRIGQNGVLFDMFKYRTMVVGADDKLKQFLKDNPDVAQEYKIYKKIKNDPRVTPIGKFLRKTSLDELPQLINIIKRRNVFGWSKTIS